MRPNLARRAEHLAGRAAPPCTARPVGRSQYVETADGLIDLLHQPEVHPPAANAAPDTVLAQVERDRAARRMPPADPQMQPLPLQVAEVRRDPHSRHVRVPVESQAHVRFRPCYQPPGPQAADPYDRIVELVLERAAHDLVHG